MSINSETAHLHQSNSQLLLSRTRLVIQSMINLDGCYKVYGYMATGLKCGAINNMRRERRYINVIHLIRYLSDDNKSSFAANRCKSDL